MRNLFKGALLALCSAAALMGGSALAQYPSKPVTFIVPWPPGDLEDVLTRMIADDFQKAYGKPAAVLNKPGGGGPFPGAAEVTKAPPDGSTIGSFVIDIPLMAHKVGIAELNPNPFEAVGIFLTYPFVIAVGEKAPYKTMQELASYAKTHKVALGHFGAESPPTKVTLALAKKLGFKYASDTAFDALDCNTLASGDVDVINTTIQLIMPCLGKIKVLAVVTEERLKLAPKAPTVKELAPELGLALWNGLFVTKGTPADVREKIAKVAKATIASAKARKFAEDTGAQIYWQDAATAKARIARDAKTMETVEASLK